MITIGSLAIPATVAVFRFSMIRKEFYPFIYFIWLGCLNEICSYYSGKYYHTTAVNNNIFNLCEALLIIWQLKRWKLFDSKNDMFLWLIIVMITFWLIEVFWISSILHFGSYFTIFHNFITVILSINLVNRLITQNHDALWKNPVFLICMQNILLFTISILIEMFWIYALGITNGFGKFVYRIFTTVSLIINLSYIFSILWMPTQKTYILRSS